MPSKYAVPRSGGVGRLLIPQLDTLDVNVRDSLKLTVEAVVVGLDVIPLLMLRDVLGALKEVLFGLDRREVLSS